MNFIKVAHAHCDGPCGHYETDSLKHAAQTCLKLVNKLVDIEPVSQNYIRLVMLKEKHAQIAKEQIYILWSDFFKAKHFEQFTDLHNQLYLLAQQASLIKQTIDKKVVDDFINQINDLDQIFKTVQNVAN